MKFDLRNLPKELTDEITRQNKEDEYLKILDEFTVINLAVELMKNGLAENGEAAYKKAFRIFNDGFILDKKIEMSNIVKDFFEGVFADKLKNSTGAELENYDDDPDYNPNEKVFIMKHHKE